MDYGGTAPNPTQFWPPIIPPLDQDEVLDEDKMNMIARKEYMNFLSEHPNLETMPMRFREDLTPLEGEF